MVTWCKPTVENNQMNAYPGEVYMLQSILVSDKDPGCYDNL